MGALQNFAWHPVQPRGRGAARTAGAQIPPFLNIVSTFPLILIDLKRLIRKFWHQPTRLHDVVFD